MEFFLKRPLKNEEIRLLSDNARLALNRLVRKHGDSLEINLSHPSVAGFGENQAAVRIGSIPINGEEVHFVAKVRLDSKNRRIISTDSLSHSLMHELNSQAAVLARLPVVRHFTSYATLPNLHVTLVPDLTQNGKYEVKELSDFFEKPLKWANVEVVKRESDRLIGFLQDMEAKKIVRPYNHQQEGISRTIQLVIDSKNHSVIPVVSDVDNVRIKTEGNPHLRKISTEIFHVTRPSRREVRV